MRKREMKMPEFLNWPTLMGFLLTLSGTVFMMWGSHINSEKGTEKIIANSNSNTDKVIDNNNASSQKILNKFDNDDLIGALTLFNAGDLVIKKGVINDLKNRALSDINQRQKIVDFLGSLNDWILECDEYSSILLSPDIDWDKWKRYEEYFKDGDNIFEKEKQIISIEASKAIDEIIFEHTKTQTSFQLNFYQKNILVGLNACDFKFNNIDFSGANLFGVYFLEAKNISRTNFIYASFYGSTIFRNVSLPKEIFINHELGKRYNGEVIFIDVQFPQGLDLTNSHFKEDIHFMKCVFHKDAIFHVATFKKSARFCACLFKTKSGFNGATFKGKVSFESSKFTGETNFRSVDFHQDVDFEGATFVIDPDFKGTVMEKVKHLKNRE